MTDFKQAIVLRDDLEMSKGKMIAQACHACLKAYRKAGKDEVEEWKKNGEKKVALNAGERELQDLLRDAERASVPASVVRDAGMTELQRGTETALGVGPAEEGKIDSVTGELGLIE